MDKEELKIKDLNDLRDLCKRLDVPLREKVFEDDCCLSWAGWYEDGTLEVRYSTDYEGKQNAVYSALFVLQKLNKIIIKDYDEILYEPRILIQTGEVFQYAIIEVVNEAGA